MKEDKRIIYSEMSESLIVIAVCMLVITACILFNTCHLITK